MPPQNLRLLAFDGGGVRGLSSLMILEQLMETIDPGSKPCDYFDMIGGTSTGGLIAIMLGRLKMSIDECIAAYLSISDRVFQKKKRHRLKFTTKIQGRFDSKELERAVKDVITAQGLSENTLLKDASDNACQVFVCATSKRTRETQCLTTYKSPLGGRDLLDSVTIWEACRATSAASSFFDSIAVGRYREKFVDGGTGANNPVGEVWNQAQLMWGPQPIENRIQCLVSIGTGVPQLKGFGDYPYQIFKTLSALATETEQTARKFQEDKRHLDDAGCYYRFNVIRGLEEIGLQESKKIADIAAATRGYIESPDVHKKMQDCANNMSGREHIGEYQTTFSLEGVPKVNQFVGRSTEMENLEHALLPQRQSCRQKVFVLHGLGGMGKTQLAVEFARLHHRRFSSVFWLDGRNEASLKRSVASCASRIPEGQISEASRTHSADGNGDLDRVVKEVMSWLRQPRNTDWLLIIDNVDRKYDPDNEDTYDVTHYFSGADHGAVLITTRLANLVQLGDSHELKKVDRPQAEAILQAWSRRQHDPAECKRLLDRLDGLPLAIAQAGAYLQQTGVGLGTYLEYYDQQWGTLMKSSDKRNARLQGYPDGSVWTTWTISYNTIKKEDQNAANLLLLWAFLDNRDLWYGLFAAACKNFPVAAMRLSEWIGDIASSEVNFSGAIGLLRNYSLVEDMENSMGYATHPVVHRWAYYFQDKASREELARLALLIVGFAVPAQSSRDYSTIARRLLPHAEACSRWVLAGEMDEVNFDKPVKDEIVLPAIANLGHLYHHQSRLGDAEKMFQWALRGYRASGIVSRAHLNTVEGLGNTYAAQGKYIKAEKMIKTALQEKEELLGTKEPSTLAAVMCLGALYLRQWNFADAEKMYERALRGCEASGTEHISKLVTLGNLGKVYEHQGKLAEAEKMLDQALRGFQEALGAEHAYTIGVVANLGRLYGKQDKMAKAEEMLEWALRAEEKTLGAEHIYTIGVVANLGVVYSRQGKLAKAEEMLEWALRAKEKTFGAGHVSTLGTVNNLGNLYKKQGNLVGAEEMYKRAIRGYEEGVGADHPWTLQVVDNLRRLHIDSEKRGGGG